ncbi:hypothetical protein QM012_002457 [Aureobasidium pullulans]|uniref:Uncharacterized protein n=1 Tax=Aureobasidium pullulans TaxID=5580 RepID=A0ABR0TBZ5_AURPU
MSNTSFRTFSTAAKASIKPASMPVKVRSAYNMSSMLQELNDIEARYKGPPNAANMTLDELWDNYYVRYRRAGPVLMWSEPWMPEPKRELLPYETVEPEASKPEVLKAEFPKPREYYLQMVFYEPPETDEKKPEEKSEDKPANASEATPKPATRPRQGIFDSIWAETPSSHFSSSQQQQPQTQKSTTSSSQPQPQQENSRSQSSSPPNKSSFPFSGPRQQTKPTASSSTPKQASTSDSRENHKNHCSSPPQNKSSTSTSDCGENHKNHPSSSPKTPSSDLGEDHKNHRRHNQKSAKKQRHQQNHPQTQASMPRQTTTFYTPLSHAHPVTNPLFNPTKRVGHGTINDSMWAS